MPELEHEIVISLFTLDPISALNRGGGELQKKCSKIVLDHCESATGGGTPFGIDWGHFKNNSKKKTQLCTLLGCWSRWAACDFICQTLFDIFWKNLELLFYSVHL